MSDLRIFSYLPNPRIWKSLVAARLCGVDVEVRGDSATALQTWLWDVDARPIEGLDPEILARAERTGRIGFRDAKLYKTDAFLSAHPFGTVPAAFSPDGLTGIFESNSIMRAVARLGAGKRQLYGRDPYEASRIDSFLDASLVFARDGQAYLLALRGGERSLADIHARTSEAFTAYASGIESALASAHRFLVGDGLSLADICFACELALFANELTHAEALGREGLKLIFSDAKTAFPRAFAHFERLAREPAFEPDFAPYLAKLNALGGARPSTAA